MGQKKMRRSAKDENVAVAAKPITIKAVNKKKLIFPLAKGRHV